ncbi:MAG: peptidyl-prolyl cis-trans isomerase [Phycisphaerae bacterium]
MLILPAVSCRSGARTPPPPPDARRPVLRTEAELSTGRAEGIRRGEVVLTEAPVVEAEQRPAPPPRPIPIRRSKDSICSDILMVNDSALTVAEVLYPLREWIEQTRATQTARGFVEQLRRRVRDHVRQEIGSLLVYEEALSDLGDPQLAALDEAVAREVDGRVSRDFGDSMARLENHLQRHGLTMEGFRELIKRRLVVSSYTREMLTPQIRIRRDELLAYYRRNLKRYCTEETRELLMIEMPFDQFLPAGVTWQTASKATRDRTKSQALRRIRAAHDALAQRDFREVAREYSHGVHAGDGGSWGQIGQPLQPPYDEPSRKIFELEEGQYSEPIETATGWYIVQCGEIDPATKTPFADVQEEIRVQLEDRRFAKLAGDYIFRLAERATISDLNAFINSAVERAVAGWSDRTASH